MGVIDNMRARWSARREERKEATPKEMTSVMLDTYGGLKGSYFAPLFGKENEAQVTCLETNAQFAGKVDLRSVMVRKNGESVRDYPHLDYLLQYRPNPTMSAEVFWERVAYYFFKYNNSFIYVEREGGEITALWSIDPTTVEVSKIKSTNEYILMFTLNGRRVEVMYSDIIHVARIVTRNMIFGDRMSPAIQNMLDLINLNYSGIENAIETSTAIKFIGTFSSVISDDKKEAAAREFTDKYLNTQNSKVGVIYSDGKVKYEPIPQASQYVANYAQMNAWNASVYKYYGCPEKVISGEATESEMLSYYERTIEPFFIRLSQEMTCKLFTRREIGFGNRIEYRDKKLLYMNMNTRMQIVNISRELGIFTKGQLGELLGMEVPAEVRDEIVTSQNYIESTQAQTVSGTGADDTSVSAEEGGEVNGDENNA